MKIEDVMIRKEQQFMGKKYSNTRIFTHANLDSILKIQKDNLTINNTSKSLDILETLVKMYSKSGDTICDFTMGAGSTGIVCNKFKRNFIGVELDDKMFYYAKNKIYLDKFKFIVIKVIFLKQVC